MLHVGRQASGGLLQPVHQWSYLGPPGCGTNSLAIGSVTSSSSFS
jgi:hypothetical protein